MNTWLKKIGSYLELTKKFNILDYYKEDHIRVILSNNQHKDVDLSEIFIKDNEKIIVTLLFVNNKYILHSYNDEPAVIYTNGNKKWYKKGLLHRDGDKPSAYHYFNNQHTFLDGVKIIVIVDKIKAYSKDGIIKRDNRKPNYVETLECKGFKIVEETTYINGTFFHTHCKLIEKDKITKLKKTGTYNYIKIEDS